MYDENNEPVGKSVLFFGHFINNLLKSTGEMTQSDKNTIGQNNFLNCKTIARSGKRKF